MVFVENFFIRIAFLFSQTLKHFKLYQKVSQKMTKVNEVRTLGLYLECDPYEIEHLLNMGHQCVRETAFQILLWSEDNYTDQVEKWTKLIEALTEMGKNTTVAELDLYKLREDAMQG